MKILKKAVKIIVVLLSINVFVISRCMACRNLEDKGDVWRWTGGPLFASLQRAPVTPSDPSGCSNGGAPGTNCPVQEMNFAGEALAHGNDYPHLANSSFAPAASNPQ
ncbi:hypothetical protein ACLOJK_032313 [Asimina triloba]